MSSVSPRPTGPVLTYPNIFEFATFPFRIRASGYTHPAYSTANPDIFKSDLQSEKKKKKKKICNESNNVRTVNPDIFEFDDVAKSCPVSYRVINQYGGTKCRPSFSRVNPDTIGYVWAGELDLNMLLVDG